VRTPGAGAVGRAPAQDDRHPAGRWRAADLGDRGGVRGRRAGVRLDAEGAQGRRSAAGAAGRAARRGGGPGRAGRGGAAGAGEEGGGEVKIGGRGAVSEGEDSDRFVADIAEVVHTHLNDEASLLVVEWWTPADGLRRIERE